MADIASSQTTATLWSYADREFGDRPFLVQLEAGGRREFSYATFARLIHRAANAFTGLGIGPGDTVVLQIGNSPEMLTALFGLTGIGAIAVPVSLEATESELLRVYRACRARWAVVEHSRLADHRAIRDRHGVGDRALLSVHGPEDDPASFEGRCRAQSDEPPAVPGVTSESVAELLYTSGTTAAPKGVMITHANLAFSGHYGVWQTSLRGDDRLFTTMPACHSNFQLAALTPVLVAGATLVMADHYSASHFWQQVQQERATVVQLIAMMARTLLLQPPSATDGRHQVREALYFMPLSDTEKVEFERRFRVRLLNSYGSTESIGWAVTDPPQGERRWPSVGRAGLGYEVGIFDPQGRELPAGEVGELRIRGVPGRTLMKGYFDDADATAAALSPDGWLRTNDEGLMDADGWFYFVDRSVNLIKRAGENISAREVECVLTAHPLIAEAAVIGVPDPVRDKAVKAFVRLVPGARIDVAEVQSFCRDRLAAFKVPEFVELVDDFPRTASLKIEKRLLN